MNTKQQPSQESLQKKAPAYRVSTHGHHAHNILFNGELMAKESFMIVGSEETAKTVCDILNDSLKPKETSGKKIEIPSVDEVAEACKFRVLCTPRYMIEQTILYCAKLFIR